MAAIKECLDDMVVLYLQSGKVVAGLPIAITQQDRARFGEVRNARLRYVLGHGKPSACVVIRSISPSGELEASIDGEILRMTLTDAGYKEVNGAYVPA